MRTVVEIIRSLDEMDKLSREEKKLRDSIDDFWNQVTRKVIDGVPFAQILVESRSIILGLRILGLQIIKNWKEEIYKTLIERQIEANKGNLKNSYEKQRLVALEIYEEIFGEIQSIVPDELPLELTDPNLFNQTLSHLSLLNSIYPTKTTDQLLNFLNSSSDFELSLIFLDKMIEGELEFDFPQKEEIRIALKNSLELLGAYSILNGIWTPDPNDKRQIITDIRIVASAIESKYGHGVETSLADLFKSV